MTDDAARPDADETPTELPRLTEIGADAALAPAVEEAREEASKDEDLEWWQAEGMPWKQKPGRADIACLTWFGVVAVFSLAIRPLRALWMAEHPDWLVMLLGSRTATAASGALAAVGRLDHWVIALVIGSIMSLKFDWIYWWAGKLWGRGMIEVWAGTSKRAARNFERAERWARKLGPIGFFIAYVPIPLPLMQVVFVISGATGMSIKKFLLYDYLASTVWLLGYFALGWWVGEPAVAILDWYAKIAGYVALVLVVVVFITAYTRSSARQKKS